MDNVSLGLIKLAGIYNVLLIVFHSFFWVLFDWKNQLAYLSLPNKALMQVLNISSTFIIFSYLSFAHTKELLTTSLGQTIIAIMSLFWFARALQQIIFS